MSPRLRFFSLPVLFAATLLAHPASGQSPPSANGRPIEGELLVKFRPTAAATERASARALVNGRALRDFSFIRVEHVKVEGMSSAQAMERLRRNPHVEYVEPNYEIQADLVPNDPRFPELYGMRNTGQTGGTAGADIKAVNAWDVFIGDPNLKVGVIDTGVDYNHPDLSANVWTNPGEIPGNSVDDDANGYVDDVHGYDFVNNDGDPFDDNGHGSHVSGTIAGVGNNNVGVTGVCWQAKIVGIKFLSAAGSGSTAGAIAGVQYAIAVGVRLTSNSWGGGGFSQALLDAINAAGAAGQLFIAAAGNSGVNTDTSPHYPSSYNTPYIISVAATDHNDNLASFSNFGATTVDLAAPGVSILSCQPGGGYQLLSGTSMATPHVAGVAALVMGRFPNIANLQAKTLIMNAADVKAQLAGKCVTGARLNAFMSIADPDETPPGTVADLATTNPGSNTLGLSWTATGDDGNVGRASSYEIRYALAPFTDLPSFLAGTPVAGPDPQPAGSAEAAQVAGLDFSTTYYFALRARDEFGNAGPVSNVASGTTLGEPNLVAGPASFSAALLTGGTETQTLTIQNTAQGTLDWTIATPELQFTQPAPHEPVVIAKGEDDWRIGDPVTSGNGGPDGAGYRWVDSNDPNGPGFAWVDITGIGTQIPLTVDDGFSAPVAMGMNFPFYGGTFNTMRVHSNGFLSFTTATGAFDGNQPLPTSGAAANLVAPFWDDLDFRTAQAPNARAYYHYDGTRLVVSWVNVPGFNGVGGPYTFQAILSPTGEIRFQYLAMGSPTNSATVGVQDGTKTLGLNVAFNTAYVQNSLAVRILQLRQWLTTQPTSGRVAAGQSQNVDVRFDASALDGGTYLGTIEVNSNDPDGPSTHSASLSVTGAPDVAVNPPGFDFGTVFVGAQPTQVMNVSNPGTAPLDVTGITSDDASVSVDEGVFTLAPRSARNLIVRFAPTFPATVNATLSLLSNDPDSPVKAIPVAGVAVPAPSFAVSPGQLSEALLTNTASSQLLRVSNSGGSNYVFTAEAQSLTPSGTVVVQSDADNVDLAKGAPDVLTGPAPLRAGGPDVFGYTYQDSDEPGGPTFSWVDISATGTPIPFNGDDQNLGPFPVGFGFPYYGATFSSFKLCTNGWLTFTTTNTQTTFTNTTLPNSGSTVPPNMLAVFWDDLDFRPANAPNARAYYQYDGTKLIIQYKNVERQPESTTNDFEILLFPNGTIVYQYLTMNAVLKTSATIGMQNATRNDGLQVVFNAAYIKNNLAIRFRPPAKFLTVTPTAGTVPPGGFVDLTVGFNAAGLFGGVYDGQIHITGNDPVLPVKDVPCQLTVTGVPDIAFTPATIDFGNVFIGFPQLRQLTINNVGTDQLVVTNVSSSDPVYGVDQTAFTVPPLGSAALFAAFSPAAATAYPATFTIASNDPDTPSGSVTLAGTGLVAPDAGTDPSSITQTLNIPATATQPLTLHNTGGSDLTFSADANLVASAVPVYEALELGKEENDPRPGVLGSGGPDLFGYRWRDSDAAGGPTFNWVDITGVGTGITLPGTGDDVNVPAIPIGFSFPFYGASFSTVNVCSNGWLSFTNTTTDLSNDPLPNSGAPENLLAVFWDDLDPDITPIRLFRHNDGTRFILSYVGVPRFSTGGPYTFQVILYPNGTIVYQYLDMQGTRLSEATIGIQNGAKNDGLTVVHNNVYMHNNLAVEFSTIPTYMTVSPTSGTIPAGGSAVLNVDFDTQGLFGGEYHGSIRIASNDPDEGALVVPTVLTALGVPNIAANPASVDFGNTYVGLTADRTVQVRNIGSETLTISGATIGNSEYSLVGASFPVALGQNGSVTLTLRFTPTSSWTPGSPCPPPTEVPSTLTVASNDPDGDLVVPITGFAVVPPEIEAQASVRAALATTLGPSAVQRTKSLILRNTGCSDLTWSAAALSAVPGSLEAPAGGATEEGPKDDPGLPGALGSGGPDAFGHRWIDSDDPNGPAFGWVDITGVGTPIDFSGDDQNRGPFPLPFSFPFYGNTFDSFRACTNGWISFTSTATTFTNTVLPSGGTTAPVNLVAPFWDDLTFSTLGDAYYHYDGEKMIISYVGVPRLGTGGGPYTFQILLYPSGVIDFQYLTMQGTRLNEATIGIQNATRDAGLQVVFNAPYVKNNLRVRIEGWLSVSPAVGVVPAGGEFALQVGFNAAGLPDGDYAGQVRIASNDLDEPLTLVPANLHVGVVSATVDMQPGSLNQNSTGNWATAFVELPAGHDVGLIRASSALVQRTVPVDANAPSEVADEDVDGIADRSLKFSRSAVRAVLPTGDAVPVELIGEEEDVTWFAGTDVIRVKPPAQTVQVLNAPTTFPTGVEVELAWQPYPGSHPDRYDLWYTGDGGGTWSLVQGGMTSQSCVWTTPSVPTALGILELVALDQNGPMGSWISPILTIQDGVTGVEGELPTQFGLRAMGANPSAGRAELELSMPQRGSVDVRIHDVRGRLVRRVASGEYEPGRHLLAWNATDETGALAGSGIYFVRLTVQGRSYTTRFALMR